MPYRQFYTCLTVPAVCIKNIIHMLSFKDYCNVWKTVNHGKYNTSLLQVIFPSFCKLFFFKRNDLVSIIGLRLGRTAVAFDFIDVFLLLILRK